jgi:alpha-1,3-rhamnosyltransferase
MEERVMVSSLGGSSLLVSVVVIAYNSEGYIIETLNSIKSQTYKNVELIITDDHSTDNTINVCKEWLLNNSDRFVRAEIVASDANTGIAANCNRGYTAAHGEWIKQIAADDILLDNCVADNVAFVNKNNDIHALFSKAKCFCDDKGERKFMEVLPSNQNELIYELSPIEQMKVLLAGNILIAGTAFLRKSVWEKFKFDERYRFLEDIPLWIRLTEAGIKLSYMPVVTILYRRNCASVSESQYTYYPKLMYESKRLYFWTEKIHIMEKYCPELISPERKSLMLYDFCTLFLHNERTFLHDILYKLLVRLVDRFNF